MERGSVNSTSSHTKTMTNSSTSVQMSVDHLSNFKDQIRNESETSVQKNKERSKSLCRIRSKIRSMFAQMKLSSHEGDFLHLFVILGSSFDLAKKKAYPTLWNLYKNDLLPQNIRFYGFARYPMTSDELREKCKKYFHLNLPDEQQRFDNFWSLHNYYIGSYVSKNDYELFYRELTNFGSINNLANRLFYIALPNTALEFVIPYLKIISHANTVVNNPKYTNKINLQRGWTRVIIEKPFGRDLESSEKLSKCLLSIFKEEEIYRIDHYLGKEMIQSMITVRFANYLFNSTWNRDYIKSVLITLKETQGVRYKGKYFDGYGIIRDVVQNHLLQILTLVAMEKPLTLKADDIRDEKLKVLKSVVPVRCEDVVLGQYIGNPKSSIDDNTRIGYTDEPEVAKKSLTPTFCTAVLKIANERWDGVPFILKCGKAMDEKLVEVRIQYKDVAADLFEGKSKRNELIIQVEPNESVNIKAMTKLPGFAFDMEETALPFDENPVRNHSNDTFEKLILDVFCGSQMHFVRSDELTEAWRIFTPLLDTIESNKIQPIYYLNGSNGPRESDDLIRKNKFIIYE